jgi:hypothetical protein
MLTLPVFVASLLGEVRYAHFDLGRDASGMPVTFGRISVGATYGNLIPVSG